MAKTTKSVSPSIATVTDEAVTAASNVITSDVFETEGMVGKTVLVQPEVTTQLTLEATSALLGVTIQYSMDGVNFVDSPKTAITPAIATTATALTTGAKTPYVVDMTDLLMPYVRAVWKAYQSDGTTSRKITAGAIKTTFCFGR
ncbi:MAG TPA: hypothetical protein P5092_16765 [Ruminococcus sp.]|nr:hypothetical protein [Ruminococcus sp.]